jgi:hypothetical protein
VKKKQFPSVVVFFSLFLLIGFFPSRQPFREDDQFRFPARRSTYIVGKQGISVIDPPEDAIFLLVERIRPPLKPRFIRGLEIAYRGPVLDIEYVDGDGDPVKSRTLTHVYFNVGEPEVKLWQEGGTGNIAIWFNGGDENNWRLCPTFLVEEKMSNGQYDRLACIFMGNGKYLLGKLERDPMFPLLFKRHDHDVLNKQNLMRSQIYVD